MGCWLEKFWRDESGAAAEHYGLISTVIAILIIGSVEQVGTTSKSTFANLQSALK